MFFSFNSEIVIFTYGRKLLEGFIGKESCWFEQVSSLSEEGVEKAQNRAALKLRGAAGSEMLPE
jgi:hypothetical protein